jgi:hypothetical protein
MSPKFRFLAPVTLLILAVGISLYAADEDGEREVWADRTTGLTWQATPTGGAMNWSNARAHCESLTLGGRSDWRLPTISELRSLIRDCPPTEFGGACGAADSCLALECGKNDCRGCANAEDSDLSGVHWPRKLSGNRWYYWSSSPVADAASYAWGVHFRRGSVLGDFKALDRLVRCVR